MSEAPLPARIYPDALIEALVELRFETAELAEAIIGRLLDAKYWSGFDRVRLPMADIPQVIRDSDTNLKYLPSIELRGHQPERAVKVGSHVLSYHTVGNYPGWGLFSGEIRQVVAELFRLVPDVTCSRIGLRYINAFWPDRHGVSGMHDLHVRVQVGETPVGAPLNVNYVLGSGSEYATTVRIATPDLVQGPIAPGYSVYCDLDVVAGNGLAGGAHQVSAWIEEAHQIEKAEFFRILGPNLTTKLGSPTGEEA